MGKTFVVHRAVNGQWYFTLLARNGNVLCTSETYHNKIDCYKAINSVRRWAFFSNIVER